MPDRKKALIAGATGVVGRNLLRYLLTLDDWDVIAVCRRKPDVEGRYEHVAVDLLDRAHLTTYLSVVRPGMLKRTNCKALWVSPKGGALSYSAIWPIITRHARKRLGIHIAPHDARDAAATTWAIAAPDQIKISRDLLAHSDLRTTTKHYNRARGIEASRTHALFIARMRRAAKS
jgi:integrase